MALGMDDANRRAVSWRAGTEATRRERRIGEKPRERGLGVEKWFGGAHGPAVNSGPKTRCAGEGA